MSFFRKILFFALFLSISRFCLAGETGPHDPYRNIDYRDAFQQDPEYKKFRGLMISLGCADNVGVSDVETEPHVPGEYTSVSIAPSLEDVHKEREDFEKACLVRLTNARRWAVTQPARESIMFLGLLGGASTGLALSLGSDSIGGGFGIFAGMFNAVYNLKDIIHSGNALYWPPAHPLDELEKQYATTKCYIPSALWRTVEEKFMLARQNPFEQRSASDFIKFALGLTSFRPAPPLRIADADHVEELSLRGATTRVLQRVKGFFEDYDSVAAEEMGCLKNNIANFLAALNGTPQQVRYMFLLGPGGIGKTYFAEQLARCINENFPESVGFEPLVITSPEELEGDQGRPGAFVKILQRECATQKRGSIVMADEATWLNQMVSPAKRVFNGNSSSLDTAYFGRAPDGSAVKLKKNPALILMASNEAISDAPLASRFDVMNFPKPKHESIVNFAKRLFRANHHVKARAALTEVNWADAERALAEKLSECHDFRRAEQIVAAYAAEWAL